MFRSAISGSLHNLNLASMEAANVDIVERPFSARRSALIRL
jgi:hypothetical protein